MVYAPRIKDIAGSKQKKKPADKHATGRPRKPGSPPVRSPSIYTRWDPTTEAFVLRTVEELNGTLSPKKPKRVERGHDDTIVIEVGQRWVEQTTKLVVIVKGIYPSVGTLVWAPNREPDFNQAPVWQKDFVAKFTPYDLVPD